MGAAKLNVYNLGSNGVNVDSNPVQLEDGELTKAQNAIHDPIGSTGGLRKRPGLTKVNSIAAAGAIRGAMGVPLSAGGQQVGPGGTAPASARTAWVGKATAASDVSTGWYTTTDLFATATVNTTPTNPVSRAKRANIAVPAVGRWSSNTPAGIQFNNRIYYAGDDYTSGTTAPTINVWDGVTCRQLCTIPSFLTSATVTQTRAVMHMCFGGDGFLYATTFGTGTTSATYEGHVWQIDPESGAVQAIGTKFTGAFPMAITWYLGRLWMGTYTGDSGVSLAKIYFIRPGIDTAWVLDFITVASPAIHRFASYRGLLYATIEGGSSGAAPLVLVRSALGAWTTSLTGTASALAVFLGSIVFKNNLYVSYFNDTGGTALIRKYDGTSWTTAFTGGVGSDTLPYYFFQNNGVMYAVSPYGDQHTILTTTDGASWTNRSANFVVTDELIPIFSTVLT